MAQQLTVQSARWPHIVVILYTALQLPKVPRYLTMACTQNSGLEAFVYSDTVVYLTLR